MPRKKKVSAQKKRKCTDKKDAIIQFSTVLSKKTQKGLYYYISAQEQYNQIVEEVHCVLRTILPNVLTDLVIRHCAQLQKLTRLPTITNHAYLYKSKSFLFSFSQLMERKRIICLQDYYFTLGSRLGIDELEDLCNSYDLWYTDHEIKISCTCVHQSTLFLHNYSRVRALFSTESLFDNPICTFTHLGEYGPFSFTNFQHLDETWKGRFDSNSEKQEFRTLGKLLKAYLEFFKRQVSNHITLTLRCRENIFFWIGQ